MRQIRIDPIESGIADLADETLKDRVAARRRDLTPVAFDRRWPN
jgi:hypothetical protein